LGCEGKANRVRHKGLFINLSGIFGRKPLSGRILAVFEPLPLFRQKINALASSTIKKDPRETRALLIGLSFKNSFY